MKSTSKQDLYLYEQVETVLRDFIPQISKNVHESFKTKPTGGFKQFLDKASLLGQEGLYTVGAKVLKRMQSAGNRATARNVEDSEKRVNAVIARELGMKTGEMQGILDTPSQAPVAPHVSHPNWAELHKTYRSQLQTWQERQALVQKMNQVRRDNPFIAAAEKTTNAEERRSRIGDEVLSRNLIPAVERKIKQVRQERISRGYTI